MVEEDREAYRQYGWKKSMYDRYGSCNSDDVFFCNTGEITDTTGK